MSSLSETISLTWKMMKLCHQRLPRWGNMWENCGDADPVSWPVSQPRFTEDDI